MIRLIIVDDQKILLEGLKKIFEGQRNIEVVSTLSFSELVEPACDRLRPDAVLLDICMEGKNSGIALTRCLKKKYPSQKVIIMTGFQDVSFIEMAREAGEHLFPDVREKVTFGACHISLTDRELDILRLVCENLSYQEIADELQISKRTVSFHISNMLSKTGHKSLIGLAVEAADKGYAPSRQK